MSIWFTRKFKFSQVAHGIPPASKGVCGAMVLDWLRLKHNGNYNSTEARRILVLRSGTGWATYKNTLMSEAQEANITPRWWENVIGHNLPLNKANGTIINYSSDDNANVFDQARVLAAAYKLLVITIGQPMGTHHIVGVYNTPNNYNGYHMLDPNFGEFRGSYAKGVRDWAHAILRRPLSGGPPVRTYMSELSHSMMITPFS